MIFLVILSGKMIFPFPENMILFLRRKMKDDVSRKNRWKYDISFKSPEKIVFPKKSRLNMIFFVLFGKMVFFPGKYDIFPLDRKWKMIFSKKYMEIWYFLYIGINVTNMIFSRKNTLKDDWHSRSHSRRSSNDSLYRDLNRHFYIFLCSGKKPRNLIYRIEIWLLLQFIWLEIFYNEESSILCTIQPSESVFRGVLHRQLRKLFFH